MKIHFWGAAQTVTGSAHYIEVNGKKILLDCGLFQGRRKDTYRINTEFKFPPEEIDAVVLSHAHIDHSGNLPNLVKHGFDGPIYAQSATAHLADYMLRDSGHIQESDARFVNKWRLRKGKEPVEPLYTQNDAEKAIQLFNKKSYDEEFEVAPGVIAKYFEAGHILGSAAIRLDIDEKGKKTRLWFSGDIGRSNLPILRDPVIPYDQNIDYLLMECTYGDRPHKSPDEAHKGLKDVIKKTIEAGGKVLIPAFAVGRTQELVYSIHRLMDSGDIPTVPVFVDSPLAVNVTDVFKAHPDCFDKEALDMITNDKHRAALGFDSLTYIRDVEESKALNERDEPMIIISTSGMMEAGRILHHLKNNIHDPKSTVLIVSWQAPHTLGRRLVEGLDEIKIFGKPYKRKIKVARVKGFSAHAGQNLLQEYAMTVKDTAKEVFLVHGEQRGANGFREALNRNHGMDGLHFPSRGTTYEV
ncbi:MAG: MBL fold metallo-hydrolase [Chloroflexi bacterium]|jgi:metallo-beta-lactamase family protein|nr:MBL fold metallo-hydrolase [Chloroflexota bacterium]MBT3671016.1 MBL fold metallo-hydrolase [Chloroflexota bacterium]MBT4003589.1 MBL fold metallo-hydrolase [Chloroflexota bacterium]MBT4305049.1 MBL fold metallo-hydrolase [Chloroflexota bacterium]MBT4533860.1 MBL fold metallo-hydrolase [Chloroflexota bacterium]